MNNKLDRIFEIVSFYDTCRWSSEREVRMKNEESLINFYDKTLNDDTKLLTHWLGYITNRQMGFERIFKEGGFVFSELADEYKKDEKDFWALLNPNSNSDSSFIQEDKETKVQKDGKEIKRYSFIGHTEPNKLINEKDIENNRVIFKSRFLPIDYFSILYTLDMLTSYQRSLSYFIAQIYKTYKVKKENLIQKILFSLYLLSYHDIKQKNYTDMNNFEEIKKDVENRTKEIKQILDNPKKFEKEFEKFQKEEIYRQKRAWCCLRDFLKSPEFNSYFEKAMLANTDLNKEELKGLSDIEMLRQLELPGDVWNNRPNFQKCIRNDEKFDNSKSNRYLREYYKGNENLKTGNSYPEQFDITFDFVPKMCDKNNCDICPIGIISNKAKKEEGFEKICLGNTSKYCTVALVGCGYKMMCKGEEECELLKLL